MKKLDSIIVAVATIVKFLSESGKSLEKAAKFLSDTVDRFGMIRVYRQLKKLMPGMSLAACKKLYALGKGTLLKDVYLGRHSRSPRILKTTVNTQLRLLNGVNVYISDTQASLRLTLSEMNCRQFAQVVDEKGRIRNVVAQRAYRNSLAKAALKPVLWCVEDGKIRVKTTGTLDLQDLRAMLFAAREV